MECVTVRIARKIIFSNILFYKIFFYKSFKVSNQIIQKLSSKHYSITYKIESQEATKISRYVF